jgi:hypothetical protein
MFDSRINLIYSVVFRRYDVMSCVGSEDEIYGYNILHNSLLYLVFLFSRK